MSRRTDTAIGFEAIRIEGGLLNAEYLARIARLEAEAQSEADYHVPRGLKLRDELGRYWRIAQALWQSFEDGLERTDRDPAAHTRDALPLPLLRDVLGFTDVQACGRIELGGRSFPIGQQAAGGQVPVVAAPHGLVQEYLNAAPDALWGLVCNGGELRLLRDNPSLTRPAYLSVDLERLFREDLYPEFQVLWLLLHHTRFAAPAGEPQACLLERWHLASEEEGVRVLGQLRVGVEQALRELGTGFAAHPDNAPLRARLQHGELPVEAFFQQLLRLIYRLIVRRGKARHGLLPIINKCSMILSNIVNAY